MPKYAYLFKYYTQSDVCLEKLKILRRHSPNVPIYGLYGGPPNHFRQFKDVVQLLDDNWEFPESIAYSDWLDMEIYEDLPFRHQNYVKTWKWINNDIMMMDWYQERGHLLDWDFLVVTSWDVLILKPPDLYVPMKSLDHVYFFPARYRVESFQNQDWEWVRPENKLFQRFSAEFRDRFGSNAPILVSRIIMEVLPKPFFDVVVPFYATLPGMNEYRFPSVIEPAGFKIKVIRGLQADNCFDFLNTSRREIQRQKILDALESLDPYPLYHPVYKSFDSRDYDNFFPAKKDFQDSDFPTTDDSLLDVQPSQETMTLWKRFQGMFGNKD